MSLGRRGGQEKQESIWIVARTLARPAGHPFYERLNAVLNEKRFDSFAERMCACFYSKTGRPGLAPGVYFRCLLVGYFEGLDSERGIAWRVADSLALRSFLGYDLSQSTPDHTTISRTRRLETPTREQLAKLDRKRAKKGSNDDWKNPHDPDAEITKMKDGRTHLAHKAEHAVDLDTGAIGRCDCAAGGGGRYTYDLRNAGYVHRTDT